MTCKNVTEARGRIFLFNSTHHFAHFEPESLVDFKRSGLSFIILPRCFSFRTRGLPTLFPLMSLVSGTYLQIFVKCLQKQAPACPLTCMRTHTHTHTLLLLLFFIRYAWLCIPAPAPMGRRSGRHVGFWQLAVTMGPTPELADASGVSFSSDVTLACCLSSLRPGFPISKLGAHLREHGGTAF